MSKSIQAESPLHHAQLEQLIGQSSEGGITLHEHKLLGHLNLRGNAADTAFLAGVQEALGVALPTAPCSSAKSELAQIMWLAPDEWLVIVESGTEFDVEQKLRSYLTGHFAVSDISGAQTLLELSGKDIIGLMKKSTGYDLHLESFPVGKVIGTTFAKTGAHILRLDENTFQLVVRRSFSDYVWLWIQQSSQEYGLTIV
ncbi:sarcosine oxidase subunit gamma [Colwellia psychrerythraea]|uniref:Sarcosine oxidase, gamma subunit family n=1 Tax=Colwellia psychrerythraea TaxID=28229 RepID=A0A099KF17_COLPS|nr:sarcosine oxidase subunit gamma family protein [Colwellia psychrerythraea]KGJ88183.1 sarcosine oxidase, gamma subunit family [Colwellia psychrerythraea]